MGKGGRVNLIVGAVQIAVGIAVLCRDRERRAPSWRDVAAAMPSLAVAGAVIAAGGASPWSPVASGLVATGGAIAVAGLGSLGRSFAVFPGVRSLKTGGLYRVIRHPIYLGESLILAGAALRLGLWGLVGFLAVIPLLVWRIRVEERLLSTEVGWIDWIASVRWRLVPGVW